MTETDLFRVREFLNIDDFHTLAAIFASVDEEGGMELTLSDCSRQISLSLDTFSAKDRVNTAHKLTLLLYVVLELLAILEDEPFYERVERAREERRAQHDLARNRLW
jgi:hypothetical protein